MKKRQNVHGGGTCKNASLRKKELALALCVSLWMAGVGVAGATEYLYLDADNNNSITPTSGWVTTPTWDSTAQTLSVTGGDWSGWNIFGGWQSPTSASEQGPAGYRLTLTGVTVDYAWGAYTVKEGAAASDNFITLDRSTAKTVYGGHATTGSTVHNTVTLTDSRAEYVYGGYAGTVDIANATDNIVTLTRTKVSDGVYGGYARKKNTRATGNSVTLTDSEVGKVYGGYLNADGRKIDGNTVTLNGGNTINGDLMGGFVYGWETGGAYDITGNTLNLSGANTGGGTVKNFEAINIKSATWGTPVLTLTGTGILQNDKTRTKSDGSWATIDASKLKFANPETVADGAMMNLIQGPVGDVTLAATATALQEYAFTPVTGVTIDAAVQGSLALTNTALTYTASNKASKLTFTDVEWKDSGALIDHATDATKNIDFDGAAVDTTKINFTNIQSLEANKKMTLVSKFGGKPGSITGEKYTVGTALEGKGKASMVGEDLIFTAETGTGGGESGGGSQGGGGLVAQEQTHNAVMGATVSMAALSAGNDFIGTATEGLSLASNVGADGVSSFAQMGGGSMRQETGSHIDAHTWNAILALGHQNKKERGTFEYGAFFEYGSGNYTTHNGDERGDGSMHYTGGGLLGKYTTRNKVYLEGSLRAGSVHDDARNVLRDVKTHLPYSYETNAPYMGFHIGVGKEIPVAGGNVVDVYGKYFYNRRNSVSFDVAQGDHYDLDAVTSQVIRVGARYVMKREKWNFYAGAAYEHELDGKAAGTASNGGVSAAIRGADTSGGSFRGEIGATMTPGENSPWNIDLNVTGFAGKKQGFTGGVSVAFLF